MTSVAFDFRAPTGAVVSSATTFGRVTALAFVATDDLYSQIALRRLSELVRAVTPRVNAAAVVMEPAQFAELLESYQRALDLPFPAVMADELTLNGVGPFGPVRALPTIVVLDGQGRERDRLDERALSENGLEQALRRAQSP
jgi:hypothetical protein